VGSNARSGCAAPLASWRRRHRPMRDFHHAEFGKGRQLAALTWQRGGQIPRTQQKLAKRRPRKGIYIMNVEQEGSWAKARGAYHQGPISGGDPPVGGPERRAKISKSRPRRVLRIKTGPLTMGKMSCTDPLHTSPIVKDPYSNCVLGTERLHGWHPPNDGRRVYERHTGPAGSGWEVRRRGRGRAGG
jgi:hypothetical protein